MIHSTRDIGFTYHYQMHAENEWHYIQSAIGVINEAVEETRALQADNSRMCGVSHCIVYIVNIVTHVALLSRLSMPYLNYTIVPSRK